MNSQTRIFETMMLTCYCSLSPLTTDGRSSTSLLMLRLPSVFHLTVFLLASCTSTSFLTIGTQRSLEFTSRAPSRDKHLSLQHKNAMVTPSSLSMAPCLIDFMKTNSGLSHYTPQNEVNHLLIRHRHSRFVTTGAARTIWICDNATMGLSGCDFNSTLTCLVLDPRSWFNTCGR
jgi:hypothetical protein